MLQNKYILVSLVKFNYAIDCYNCVAFNGGNCNSYLRGCAANEGFCVVKNTLEN